MQASVHIRRIAAADLEQWLPLCAEHAAYERLTYSPDGGMEELVRALTAEPPLLFAWIAMANESAIGYASATVDFSTLDHATYLHMDCLFVRDGWRGRGIGQQLWSAVHAFARARGCRTVQWQTPEWNVDAARFYLRLGATEMIKRRYVLPIETA
ncbi:GNAT family N-acetyltransferase [Dyella acidisoli]|uniref:N-acetyltransferase n=1 Tax=Dyella acidisoli TaxID=1867834 RepID=A0ABQ5XIA8_9GAMM|nr:N-acetyltransferase [Dyella acidisoli]